MFHQREDPTLLGAGIREILDVPDTESNIATSTNLADLLILFRKVHAKPGT